MKGAITRLEPESRCRNWSPQTRAELADSQAWGRPRVCVARSKSEKKHQNVPFCRIPTFSNILLKPYL